MSYIEQCQSPELRLDQQNENVSGAGSNCDDSAADNSMQFPGNTNNTFFCSDQKGIDFNVSHQFDVSKVEDDESDQLKKVLIQLRQQLVIQKTIILRDKQIKIKLVEELKKFKREIEDLKTKYSTKSIVSKVQNVHLKFSHLKKKQKLQLRTGRYAASSFLVGQGRRRNLLHDQTDQNDDSKLNEAEQEYKHQQSLLFGSFGSPSQQDAQDQPGYFGKQQFKMMTKEINQRESRSRSGSPLKQRSQSYDLSPEHQVTMVFPTERNSSPNRKSPNRKSTMKTVKRPRQIDLSDKVEGHEDHSFQMADESAVKCGPEEEVEDEDSLKTCEKLQLRLSNPRQSLPVVMNEGNNIYEESHKWDGSQSSFHDGTCDRLSAPRKLEKQDSRCQSNIDQIEVCYSDMPSIEHRETMIQQYSKEPLNGSTSRGTAINLQEELEEIAPFKGSYHVENIEKPIVETPEDTDEPEFFKQVKKFNKLNKNTANCDFSSSDSEPVPVKAYNNYQQNFEALQIKLNNKQQEVQRKCTFGKQTQLPIKTPSFVDKNQQNKSVEWDTKVRFSDVLQSLNKIQKNLVDLKKKPELEMNNLQKGRYSLALHKLQKNSQKQRQTLNGWRQNNDDEIFQSVAISDSNFSSKVKIQNRLSTFSTQVKKQRREQEKSKIIDYSDRLKTSNKRGGHQRKISGMTFQTAKETEQQEMDVFQSFIRESNATNDVGLQNSDGENSTEMWKQPNPCDQSIVSDNAMPFQMNEASTNLDNSKKAQIDKNLSQLKNNLFQFMNDLEMFKHNLESVCRSYNHKELEMLMENPYFQLISCILDCIYKKVMQIKSIFDFKNKEDNWDARSQMKII